MTDAPRVEGLAHLRHIIWEEMERAKREGVGCLCLEGCLRAGDRALVDEQVRLLAATEPGCRLLAAHPTADGYVVAFGRVMEYVLEQATPIDLPVAD
jgi:hypothetical protein